MSPEFGLPKALLTQAARGNQSFYEHFEAASKVHFIHHLDQELETIYEIGRRLSRTMNIADLKEYKQKIADFLQLCISQGFCFKEEKLPYHYGRTKVLSIVKTVNQKLITLAEMLLSENSDSMKIVALVDEIRGLLLDIYA